MSLMLLEIWRHFSGENANLMLINLSIGGCAVQFSKNWVTFMFQATKLTIKTFLSKLTVNQAFSRHHIAPEDLTFLKHPSFLLFSITKGGNVLVPSEFAPASIVSLFLLCFPAP